MTKTGVSISILNYPNLTASNNNSIKQLYTQNKHLYVSVHGMLNVLHVFVHLTAFYWQPYSSDGGTTTKEKGNCNLTKEEG